MKVDEMRAGPRLNYLVGLHVMELDFSQCPSRHDYYWDGGAMVPVPDYSGDIAAAWRVKAEMVKRGWTILLEQDIDKSLVVNFYKGSVTGSYTLDAKTEADEARCIVSAALDALRNAGEVPDHAETN